LDLINLLIYLYMAGFRVVKSVEEAQLKKLTITSLTLAVGELIEQVAGATTWTACTSSSTHYTRKAICMEATTSGSSVLAYILTGHEEVIATVGTASAADNGDAMVLTNSTTVNNTGTNSTAKEACFLQTGIGAITTEIVGRVLVGDGLNSAAT
jgi:hypothetical protein